jgi:hypothetical protein
MDGHPRFVRPSAPVAPASVGLLAPAASPLVSARLNRRQAVQGLGAGAAALVAGAHGLRLSVPSAAARASNVKLTNPCSRVLMPGDKGLHDFSLEFSLSGAPTVFFFAGDTPGWSSDVKGSLDGFVFGYAATLADSKQSTGSGGRAVQVCVHHGFPSSADADIAWISLTTALNSRAYDSSDAKVQSLDLVEVIVVDGESILATVAGGQTNAIVLASRSGSDLVTVAIADFEGKSPSADEALDLAEAEGKKLSQSREIERRDLGSAFAAQWTPGFQLGSASGAPFFAWPTLKDHAAVPVTSESSSQLEFRRQANAAITHQSHIEGPFWENAPAFSSHALYYSAQSNFFDSSKDAKSHHEGMGDRLRASMPDATLIEVHIGSRERRYAYESWTSYGPVSAITLHYIVKDGDFPLSLSMHIVAVPYGADSPALDLGEVIDRLDGTLKEMRGGLEDALLRPDNAPLMVAINAPS